MNDLLLLTSLRVGVLACFVGLCIFTDIKERKIYNKITFTGMLAGLIINTVLQATPHPESGLLFGIQGILLGIILFFLPFSLGGLGAGDLKMLGMTGAFLGWPLIGWTGFYAAIAGGVISLFILLVNRTVRSTAVEYLSNILLATVHSLKIDIAKLQTSGYRFPYSIAIAAGTVLALLLKR
jgi:prepilin peptidase CpaA